MAAPIRKRRADGDQTMNQLMRMHKPPAQGADRAVQAAARPAINLESTGRPLSSHVRSSLEPQFGHDFGSVRVHTDDQAARSAAAVDAQAFTLGSEIYFGAGEFQSDTSDGQELLGHELTHVVQQSGSGGMTGSELPVS